MGHHNLLRRDLKVQQVRQLRCFGGLHHATACMTSVLKQWQDRRHTIRPHPTVGEKDVGDFCSIQAQEAVPRARQGCVPSNQHAINVKHCADGVTRSGDAGEAATSCSKNPPGHPEG